MMEKILEILKSIRSDIDFENETKLIDDGILDSFDIVSIVAELCDAYDITITAEDMEPENFNSVQAMLALVERIMDEA
ncbi:MAG: acyl carrier protein [Clostridiales bacterium]|nr:acyl carrier protein [Clostridiales bacterium]